MKHEPTLFKQVNYSLNKLIQDIDTGEIGLPDIQRPFVWSDTKVRDLFDSMYKGFPVGYLLFWSNNASNNIKMIGTGSKQSAPRLLIVDGQQRLTSLYAILKSTPVKGNDYSDKQISIAFRPKDGTFEVSNAIIKKDPEFISNISELWSGNPTRNRFVKQFIENIRSHNINLTENEEDALIEAIDRLYDLQNYPFTALELSPSISEELVADIFVRINSQGVVLNKSDFILTLMSVFWDAGRSDLEKFCYNSRKPSLMKNASPFNYFIQPDPDELLRVSIAVGFRRARLQHAYSLLRGKDFDSREFLEEKRESQFKILAEAQSKVLNLSNWHEFLKSLLQSGFRSEAMITSKITIIFSYAMFIIGKEFGLDHASLRNIISRWFFVTSLISRYTGSFEGVMESDLARLRNTKDADEFLKTLEQIISDELTEDFWNIGLPNNLDTSASRSPTLFAYYASLNILNAYVLFSRVKISELLDPAIKSTKSALDKHHLFPRKYLEKIGITDTKDINKIANFALVEWPDNIDISDLSPSAYFPNYSERMSKKMQYWHALPNGWEKMKYDEFLKKRRTLMSKVIRDAYNLLTSGHNVVDKEDISILELIKKGESDNTEFKSSLLWDYKKDQITKEYFVPFSVIKTIAAFMNSEGGNLIIGVDDSGNILGIEKDFTYFNERQNWDGWCQHLVNLINKYISSGVTELIKIESQDIGGKTIANVYVKMSPKPIFVDYKDNNGKDNTDFFIRSLNTTQNLDKRQTHDYISMHWNKG